jgi:hypothetical protein
MKLKTISVLVMGLLLSSVVIAQDEVLDTAADDVVVEEGTLDMDIPAVSAEEMVALVQQDCQEMAKDEGLEGDDANAYVETCTADIMAAETEVEDEGASEEDGGEMAATDEAYEEVADDGEEEVPPATE